MLAGFREQNKIVQMSAACQRGLRHAQGDTIESRGYVNGDLRTAVQVECMLRMVLCSRASRKNIEGFHDGPATNLQISVQLL
jgi:hypothetical protein